MFTIRFYLTDNSRNLDDATFIKEIHSSVIPCVNEDIMFSDKEVEYNHVYKVLNVCTCYEDNDEETTIEITLRKEI